jgi:hypothetical protein
MGAAWPWMEGVDVSTGNWTPVNDGTRTMSGPRAGWALELRAVSDVLKSFQPGHFSGYGFHRKELGPSLSLMSLKWRWCLLVVIASTAFGVFIPNGQPSAAPQPSRTATLLAEELVAGSITCFGVSCNKGAPAPITPPLNIAAVCAVVTGVIAFAMTRVTKRIRPKVVPLPQGHLTVPLRPPRLISF